MSQLQKMLEYVERMLKYSIDSREFWEGRVLKLKKAIEEENITDEETVSKVKKFWEEKLTPMVYHLISIGAGILGITFTILNVIQLAMLFDVTSLTSACIGVARQELRVHHLTS